MNIDGLSGTAMVAQHVYQRQFIVQNAQIGIDASALIQAQVNLAGALGGGIVVLPFIGGYTCASRINITASNVYIALGDNVTFTFTSKSTGFLFSSGSSATRLSCVGIYGLVGTPTINGNGANITGYAYNINDTLYSSILFEWCDDVLVQRVYAYNGLVNCCRAAYCTRVKFFDSQASGAQYDNGFSIDFDPSPSTWSATDPTTWSSSVMRNIRAWNIRSGFGATLYACTDSKIEDATVWGCGNDNTSLPVSGGGISVEGDYLGAGNDMLLRNNRVFRVNVSLCYNAGIFLTARGIHLDSCFAQGTIKPVNRTDTTNTLGSDYYITGSAQVFAVRCRSLNAGLHGVAMLASGFTMTANTTSGSNQLVVTSIGADLIPGGILSGTGLSSIQNPATAANGGGTLISSGSAGGTGTYTMSQVATSSQTGTTISCCFMPYVEWDGHIARPQAGYGIYGRGFLYHSVSRDSEVLFAYDHGFYYDASGSAWYGAGFNHLEVFAKRVYQCNNRALYAYYCGRALCEISLIEGCRLTAGQGSQISVSYCNYSAIRNTRNIDLNSNTAEIAYIDNGCTNGQIENISGDHASGNGASRNNATNRFLPASTGVQIKNWRKTASSTVTNTTTATSIASATAALVTMQANQAFVGREYSWSAEGNISTAASAGNLTIAIYLGTTVIATATIAPGNSLSGVSWNVTGRLIVRSIGSAGTVQVDGQIALSNGVVAALDNAGAAITINTTASQAWDMTAAWATASASNTITCNNATFQIEGA
jgi:hypothetical protein